MPPPDPPIPELLREQPAPPKPPPPKDDEGTLQQLGKVSAIGTSFAVTVAAGLLLGWAIQHWAIPSWSPWPLIGGCVAGLIVAAIRFVKDAQSLNNDPKSGAR